MKIICGKCKDELDYESQDIWPGTPVGEPVYIVAPCCAPLSVELISEEVDQKLEMAYDIADTIGVNPVGSTQYVEDIQTIMEYLQEARNSLSLLHNSAD